MLERLKKNNKDGFTIIEVMIVLAIAGLILLIVFLAVPALQRNARNTSRKNDISSLGSAISEYVDNQNGAVPTTAANFTNNWKPGYYTAADINIVNFADTTAVTPTAPTSIDKINVTEYGACNTNGTAGAVGVSSRSIAVTYYVEAPGVTTGGIAGAQEECTTAQ
jgi:prepilin-type N-terminal cleavage/methylation domain-containing protein